MSEKLYIINTTKRIGCLNNITGPITKPTPLDPADALRLVKQGMEVYEVNPYDKNEKVKVTTFNFNSILFKTSQMDMLKKKKLNRELQNMDKAEKVTPKKEEPKVEPEKKEDKKDEPKKDESKKEDKKSDKKVEAPIVAPEKPSHTDFQKH